MEHCKIKSRDPRTNSILVRILFFFSIVSPGMAGQTAQTLSTPSKILFTWNRPIDFHWSGPYLGGYIGGAWGDSKVTTTAGSVSSTSYFPSNDNINAVSQTGSQTFIPNIFVGGVQLGDNWTVKNYVYGFIFDYGSLNFGDKKVVTNSAYPDGSGNYTIRTSINTDWMYTIRGRLGWTPESSWPILLYGTGGLAVTQLKVSNQFSDSTTLEGIGAGHRNNTINGWSLGLGLELPITQNLTINSEYLYANFGSVNVQNSVYNSAGGFGIDYQSLVSPLSTTAHLYANFFKVGLSYKFNPGIARRDQK